jgi:hypothetical protein
VSPEEAEGVLLFKENNKAIRDFILNIYREKKLFILKHEFYFNTVSGLLPMKGH